MTVQFPDVLINEHPQLDMTSLYLYSVIRGDVYSNHGWGEPYKFSRQRKPPEKAVISSALWRGHIATFRLQSNGELILEEYRYPLSLQTAHVQTIRETLHGEFWMVMKPRFDGPRTYVPFRNGRISTDADQWVHELGGNSPQDSVLPGIDELNTSSVQRNRMIWSDPSVQCGKPVFAGTTVPVAALFDHLICGGGIHEFVHQFSTITEEHVVAVLKKAEYTLTRDA